MTALDDGRCRCLDPSGALWTGQSMCCPGFATSAALAGMPNLRRLYLGPGTEVRDGDLSVLDGLHHLSTSAKLALNVGMSAVLLVFLLNPIREIATGQAPVFFLAAIALALVTLAAILSVFKPWGWSVPPETGTEPSAHADATRRSPPDRPEPPRDERTRQVQRDAYGVSSWSTGA